uniref:Ribosome assembly factor mrt4 n=1 Tax=Clastoptera arizonana TaxID=38151 RepID=A0A1B6CLC1_9HEMI
MPKSKRDKKVSLTKTTKKGLPVKQQLVGDIRKAMEEYPNIFVFNIQNMRNGKLKELRGYWKHSRFFFGKNKVMSLALGKSPQEESQTNSHLLVKYIKGQCGLLFTKEPKKDVIDWFEQYKEDDFARSGNLATETVILPEGPLPDFSHAIEPHLRQLGLPTSLQRGVVTLLKEHIVCKVGEMLSPEQARILKLLGKQMAEFKLTLICVWTKDGSFEKLHRKKKDKSSKNKETNEINQTEDVEMNQL